MKSLRKGCCEFLTLVEQIEWLDNDPNAERSGKVSVEVQGEKKQVEALLPDYKDRFPECLPARLPPFRAVNHEIDLEPGTPPSQPGYRLSKPELEELERQIDELFKRIYPAEPITIWGTCVLRKEEGWKLSSRVWLATIE